MIQNKKILNSFFERIEFLCFVNVETDSRLEYLGTRVSSVKWVMVWWKLSRKVDGFVLLAAEICSRLYKCLAIFCNQNLLEGKGFASSPDVHSSNTDESLTAQHRMPLNLCSNGKILPFGSKASRKKIIGVL